MVAMLWPCCLATHSGFLPTIKFQLTMSAERCRQRRASVQEGARPSEVERTEDSEQVLMDGPVSISELECALQDADGVVVTPRSA